MQSVFQFPHIGLQRLDLGIHCFFVDFAILELSRDVAAQLFQGEHVLLIFGDGLLEIGPISKGSQFKKAGIELVQQSLHVSILVQGQEDVLGGGHGRKSNQPICYKHSQRLGGRIQIIQLSNIKSERVRQYHNISLRFLFRESNIRQAFLMSLPALIVLLLFLHTIPSSSRSCSQPNCQVCDGLMCVACSPGLTCCQRSCTLCINQTQCGACAQGFAYNGLLSNCQLENSCLQPACASCTNSSCKQCQSGFVLDAESFQCIKCPSNCQVCTLDGACVACQLTYFLSQGICTSCAILDCLACSNSQVCTKCSPGNVVEQGSCSSCPSGCSYCSAAGSCTSCSSSYYLNSAGKCRSCSSSCLNCFGTSSNCTTCPSNSILRNNTCLQCFVLIPFCITCGFNATAVVCLGCSEGMFSGGNSCSSCPEGCAVCSSHSQCSACTDYYYLLNGGCYPCNMANCLTCANNITCLSCRAGFYSPITSTQCLACPPNCFICSSTKCSICNDGYYNSNGICLPCAPNCLSCATGITCTSCAVGFHGLSQLSAPNQLCIPCPLYCVNCLSQTSCISCSPGFLQTGRKCLPCPVSNCHNCASSDNSTYCELCAVGYFPTPNATQCLPCPPHCSSCPNSTYCWACLKGFSVSDGVCVSCPHGCTACVVEGVVGVGCLGCLEGFYSTGSSMNCMPCQTGCAVCLSSTYCVSCDSGYYLNRTQLTAQACQKCVPPCLTCSNSTLCSTCASGYVPVAPGLCSPCPSGCFSCNQQHCLECIDGYALTYSARSLTCTLCPTGCIRCASSMQHELSKTTIECLQCPYNWTLIQNQSCIQCGSTSQTQGCASCSSAGRCAKCFSGFVLNESLQCSNNNQETLQDEQWGLIGGCIGLGCGAMVLIVLLLYLKLRRKTD